MKLNFYRKTGHCYPDLVEKTGSKVVAEMRGNIWKSNFIEINDKFKSVLNEELGDNMTVVFLAKVKYHPVYGLSLNITDVDPAYTLGEMAKQKAENIRKLKDEGIFEANKNTSLPIIPKVIAVISVSTSKGYQDFLSVIDNNSFQYEFHHLLFPAILQGERAVKTILEKLDRVKKYIEVFDAVAIIRGGGGDVGLGCYDDYMLAREVANFPIPVLTGIGHSTNETVTEMVSYKSFITPTKMAEFLIQKYHNFAVPLKEHTERINNQVKWIFEQQQAKLKESARLFSSLTNRIFDKQRSDISRNTVAIANSAKTILSDNKENLKTKVSKMQFATSRFIQSQNHVLEKFSDKIGSRSAKVIDMRKQYLKEHQKSIKVESEKMQKQAMQKLQFLEEKTQMLHPGNVLKRGYSITRINGKSVKEASSLFINDEIETEFYQGKVKSKVENIKANKKNT